MSKLGDNLKSATETAPESIAHAGEKNPGASTAASAAAAFLTAASSEPVTK